MTQQSKPSKNNIAWGCGVGFLVFLLYMMIWGIAWFFGPEYVLAGWVFGVIGLVLATMVGFGAGLLTILLTHKEGDRS